MNLVWKIIGSFIILNLIAFVLLWPPNNTALGVEEEQLRQVFVSQPVEAGISVAVRDLPALDFDPLLDREINPRQNPNFLDGVGENMVGPRDPLLQTTQRNSGRAPSPILNFDGQMSDGSVPPDTIGDVGPNHYVQMVNAAFAMYDKSGQQIQAPRQINQLWEGSGQTNCTNRNEGDPIVLYDRLADRWLLSQFASPTYLCIAISRTADPTGSYYTYEFNVQRFPDYFKFGVWPDGYYMSANEGGDTGYTAYAFHRAKMLAGKAASFQKEDGQKNLLLPSDLDGATAPPANSPNYFYTFKDDDYSNHDSNQDVIEVWAFDVDWENANKTTFTLAASLPIAPFTYSVCGHFNFNCIRQPGTGQRVDSVSEWPMWRTPYRNFGTHETIVGNFTVDVGDDQAGIRWFELRKSQKAGNGKWQLHQEGTHAPDNTHRWMGSIAIDQVGNIALGYSVSGSDLNPGIRYTTRLATDAEGTLSEEEVLQAGSASQSNSNRWGDYSSLNVDPTDDCTFWYTNEYISASTAQWQTRIGTFNLPSCTQKNATPTPTPVPFTSSCHTAKLAIGDSSNVLTDTQTLTGEGKITDLDVSITADYPTVGDLVFTLAHGSGITVTLMDRPGFPTDTLGCQEANIEAILDDEAQSPVESACAPTEPTISGRFQPHEPLSLFDGQVVSTTWTLSITHPITSSDGILTEWCLITSSAVEYDFYFPLIFKEFLASEPD